MNAHNKLQEMMEDYNPHKQLLEQTRGLIEKWKPTGLLEGIDSETKRSGMSVLLENQAKMVFFLEGMVVLGQVRYQNQLP